MEKENNTMYCESCHKVQSQNMPMVRNSKPLKKIQKRTGVLFTQICSRCNAMLKPMRIREGEENIPLVWLRTIMKDAERGFFSNDLHSKLQQAEQTKYDLQTVVRKAHKKLANAVSELNYATQTTSALNVLYANHLWDTYQERRKRANYAISNQDLRLMVFGRDGFKCVLCKSRKMITIDHIKPVLLGGTDDLDNLQTLCKSCNSKKGATYE